MKVSPWSWYVTLRISDVYAVMTPGCACTWRSGGEKGSKLVMQMKDKQVSIVPYALHRLLCMRACMHVCVSACLYLSQHLAEQQSWLGPAALA